MRLACTRGVVGGSQDLGKSAHEHFRIVSIKSVRPVVAWDGGCRGSAAAVTVMILRGLQAGLQRALLLRIARRRALPGRADRGESKRLEIHNHQNAGGYTDNITSIPPQFPLFNRRINTVIYCIKDVFKDLYDFPTNEFKYQLMRRGKEEMSVDAGICILDAGSASAAAAERQRRIIIEGVLAQISTAIKPNLPFSAR